MCPALFREFLLLFSGNSDAFFREKCLTKNKFLNISIDAAVQDERKEPDTTTYQIMKELQNCSEDERQIALRTLRGLLSALKEKDPLN